jgi:hypothetical protein
MKNSNDTSRNRSCDLPAYSTMSQPTAPLRAPLKPLNAKLNAICHLLALLGGATIVVVSRLKVNVVTMVLN